MDSAIFHLAEVLYVATFAMGWFCRCCDAPTGVLCTLCENDLRAEFYQLDISGFANDECTGCTQLNGTYVLWNDTACFLFGQDIESLDPPVLDSLFPVTCTPAIGITMLLQITGVGNSVDITWVSREDGGNNESWRYRSDDSGSNQPCLDWVENPHPFELSTAQINFNNIARRACNGNSAFVTTTAL